MPLKKNHATEITIINQPKFKFHTFPSFARQAEIASNGTLPSVHFLSWTVIPAIKALSLSGAKLSSAVLDFDLPSTDESSFDSWLFASLRRREIAAYDI